MINEEIGGIIMMLFIVMKLFYKPQLYKLREP